MNIGKRRVLFLCTGNSARSQMAEALLQLIAGENFETYSAGTHPAGVNPMTIEVMKELGVDISYQRSKDIQEFLGQTFDYVITVCDRARESCPIFPEALNVRHWSFEDPAAAPPQTQRVVLSRVRDEITDRICQFLIEEGGITPAALQCYGR